MQTTLKPKRKRQETSASKVRHIPNDTSARSEEKKVRIPIIILMAIIFGCGMFIFSLLFRPSNNDLPDYMTSHSTGKQLDIPKEEPQQMEQLAQPQTISDAIFYMFSEGGWFKFIIFIPLIVIFWQIVNSFMRAMR